MQIQDIIPPADSLKEEVLDNVTRIKADPGAFVEELGQKAVEFGFKVLAALAIYIVGAWLISVIAKLLRRSFERRGTEKTVSSFIISFLKIVLWAILIAIVIGALGINTSSIAALLAAGGVTIGMALSGTVQNFAGGLILLIFKPFRAGDVIDFNGTIGTVTEINIIQTKIISPDGKLIVLPNGGLSSGTITNITARDLRRVDFHVCVAYGTDAAKCEEAMLAIARADERVLDATTPGADDPMAAILKMEDSSVRLLLRVWVRSDQYWPVTFALNEALYSQLPAQGFHFEYPQMEIRIKS